MNGEKKVKTCMKCHRTLPQGYKHLYCESCRNQQVENIKNGGGVVVAGVALASAAGAKAIINILKGKINL